MILAPDQPPIRARLRRRRAVRLAVLLFLAPWLIGFVGLVVYPFVASLVWSLTRYDMLSPPRYVGQENYRRLADELLGGGRFGVALYNTAYFALTSVPLSIALGIALAAMLSWRVRGQAIFRTIFFLPSVMPVSKKSVLFVIRPMPGKCLTVGSTPPASIP